VTKRNSPSAGGATPERLRLTDLGIVGWYVANTGTAYRSAPLTEEERRVVEVARGKEHFPAKACFHNAQRLVLGDTTGNLHYAEGFKDDCFHHGWVLINGKVIDLTQGHGNVLGTFDENRTSYFGVRLCRDAWLGRLGCSVFDDWEHGFPVIRAFETATGNSFIPRR
jgi:hypothetical protein